MIEEAKEAKSHGLPRQRSLGRLDTCASGRPRAEVRNELKNVRQRALDVDRLLHMQKVEICRKEWDIKYKGEHRFDPEAAYTSLVPGERLDQNLCNEFYDLNRMIVLLNEELEEPLPREVRS